MDKESLLGFISLAHKNTYAAPTEVKIKYKSTRPIIKGHKEYVFSDGDWIYYDTYSGWYWPPGKEIVFFKGNPVWTMAYQGKVIGKQSDEFIEQVFEFLKKALRASPVDAPFRGPKSFSEGDFSYSFKFSGGVSYFKGRETITFKGKKVFFQDVMGELIK